MSSESPFAAVLDHVSRDRLLRSAVAMIDVPSPTGDCGKVLDRTAAILAEDGFAVERDPAGHPSAPAVFAELRGAEPGRCMQFNGHLDVVHLPYVGPRIEGNLLRGSGSCDMKAGTAAALEAMRAIRDSGLLRRGSVMFSANDLHEAPWGDGRQLDDLIRRGRHGDAVLIPESIRTHLPIMGRGSAVWKVTIRREGDPVHEVMRPPEAPWVISAGAELVRKLLQLNDRLQQQPETIAGRPSVFIGQIHSGEIFNQLPNVCMLEGTRRWNAGTEVTDVEAEFRTILRDVESAERVSVDVRWQPIRGPFTLDPSSRLVRAFQSCHTALSGSPLPTGPKAFVDDGNSFSSIKQIPAITHGPRGGGQHTVEEWVDIDDLVRVARQYALTALTYLAEGEPSP